MSTEITSPEPNTQPTPTVHNGPYGPISDPAPGCEWAAPNETHPQVVDFTNHPNYLSADQFTRDPLREGHALPYLRTLDPNFDWNGGPS